jgi:nucleoside-diphosphate-sugar epimerase
MTESIVVTGATGFLGRILCDSLVAAGYDVCGVDLNPPTEAVPWRFERVDVRNPSEVQTALEGSDIVVNNAALVPVTRSTLEEYRSVNVAGTRNVFAVAQSNDMYVMHISSTALYGVPEELPIRIDSPMRPVCAYGKSKVEAEGLVAEARSNGLRISNLRPRTLIGTGRLGLLDVIFPRIRDGRRVPVFGDGNNRLQLCDAQDFADAAVSAVRKRANADYAIGAEVFGTVREDMQELIRRVGSSSKVAGVPVPLIHSVVRPLQAVGRSPFTEWHYKTAFVPFYCDISPAKRDLDWSPRFSNADALERSYRYFESRDGAVVGESAHLNHLQGALARILRGG